MIIKRSANLNLNFPPPRKLRNFPISKMSAIIVNKIAIVIIRVFKFITSDGKFGIRVGSLKYRIVESKITLLTDALNPLII